MEALRLLARNERELKPMTGFGDPLFDPMPDDASAYLAF